ncbi:MAG: hypothetical protein WC128_09015 [Bacteroidales bacterium]
MPTSFLHIHCGTIGTRSDCHHLIHVAIVVIEILPSDSTQDYHCLRRCQMAVDWQDCALPPRDELPLINVQAALKLYYNLEVLSPTRYENPAKVRLVGRFFHFCGSNL